MPPGGLEPPTRRQCDRFRLEQALGFDADLIQRLET
jgi:hypothetical protein